MKARLKKLVGKHKKYLTKKNVFIGIISLLLFALYIQMQVALGTFSFLKGQGSSLISELGQMRGAYAQIGQDLNEVRGFLQLPLADYEGIDAQEVVGEDENDNNLQLALFSYVDSLAAERARAAKLALNSGIVQRAPELASLISDAGLSMSPLKDDADSSSFSILDGDAHEILTYRLDKATGSLFAETMRSKEEVKIESFDTFKAELYEFLKNDKSKLIKYINDLAALRQQVEAAINSVNIQVVLQTQGLNLNTEYTSDGLKYTYAITNKSDDLVAQMIIDADALEVKLQEIGGSTKTASDLAADLATFLGKLDARSHVEKNIASTLKNLTESINDRGFKLLLKDSGMSVSSKPREDEFRYYFDIFANGQKVSSIVLEKKTGVVNIVDKNGAGAQNILFFDPDFKKKTLEIPENLPDYGNKVGHSDNSMNILIAGRQGSNVDTMIFAHINEDKKTVNLISIPRDLFYEGRKINALASMYGMPALKTALSKISGYELDKYILIDMYAFIDVVDLIGGIDLRLDSPLVDPTYKVVDNGIASTLHYDAGDYHFNGVETMRVARSRHTSSDFARAERQQKILAAIQNRARNFGLGDSGTIYQIVKTVLAKTETDISLNEALAYFFRYQNYKIASMDVISSGNVMYVPPYITTENCAALVQQAGGSHECESQNHAYTLLPRDGNWNLIKWFFKDKFEA